MFNFVYFLTADWETISRRPHFSAMSKYGRILIVEFPITINKFLNFKEFLVWFKNKRKLRTYNNKINVIKPFLPIPNRIAKNFNLFLKMNNCLLKKTVNKCLSNLDMIKPIVFLTSYSQMHLKDLITNRLTCLELSDEWSLFSPLGSKKAEACKIAIIETVRSVDIVFATSKLLADEYKSYNKNTFYVPNACETDFFKKTLALDTEIYEPLKDIPHPRIGFIGGLAEYIDIDLILYILKKKPNWSIIFSANNIAPIFSQNKKIKGDLNKIYFVGVKLGNRKSMVPYEKLPNFLKGLDVCVHFFSINHPITKYAHSNKFYMYLAAGKAVVTLNFLPELAETFGNLVKVANSYDEYIKYIEEAMSENCENEIKRRISFAEKNSLDARAKKKIMIIKKFININRIVKLI